MVKLPLYCVTDYSFLCNLIKGGLVKCSLPEINDWNNKAQEQNVCNPLDA